MKTKFLFYGFFDCDIIDNKDVVDVNLQKLFNDKIVSTKEIKKGFSPDRKIIVNEKYLVRIIPLDRVNYFKEVFRVQKNFGKVALCQKAFKLTSDDDFGYYITEYLKGKNGLEVIESYSNEKQYEFGIIAAKELVKFHRQYPLPDFNVKIHLDNYLRNKINASLKHNVKEILPEINDIIHLVKNNIHHLYNLQGVQTHADYHLFNMIFDRDKYKGVIDFERVRAGILLTDFRNNTPHNSEISPHFASGFIDGYLDEIPVKDFFLMYNIYDLLLTIAAIPWVQQFDSENIDKSIKMIKSIYEQKDDLKSSPKWYVGKY